jgi:hemoglobin-like flavoprotein
MDSLDRLTSSDIREVQAAFDLMWPRSTAMADQFYNRLFEIAPDCRPMFHSDMATMKGKFISTLAVLVGSLANETGLYSVTGKLARDHVHFGVRPEHYAPVGEALIWSFRQQLGPRWTDNTEQSWRKVYALIASRMIAAAYQ